MRHLVLVALLAPVLACAQPVQLGGSASGSSAAGPQKPKVVQLSGTATATGGLRPK